MSQEQIIRDQQARIELLEDWLYRIVESFGCEISIEPAEPRPEGSQVVVYPTNRDKRVDIVASDEPVWDADDGVLFLVGEPDGEG